MSIPNELRYTPDHEWARLEGDGTVTVGITHHAQDALGDVVYVELPEVGATLDAGAQFGVVESVKTVSDLFAPCAGEVVAVNAHLKDAPVVYTRVVFMMDAETSRTRPRRSTPSRTVPAGC